jgi:hypothetical protein
MLPFDIPPEGKVQFEMIKRINVLLKYFLYVEIQSEKLSCFLRTHRGKDKMSYCWLFVLLSPSLK